MGINASDESLYIGNSQNAPVKLITELNIGDYEIGGGSEEPTVVPDLPDENDLRVGNTITWADKQWIVVHVTSTEAYLALTELTGSSVSFMSLSAQCTNWLINFSAEQLACLKTTISGSTNGKVFVATQEQLSGEFSYFTDNSRRALGEVYWTSSEGDSITISYGVGADGSIGFYNSFDSHRFRPFVCIDLTLYDSQQGGSEEGTTTDSDFPVQNVSTTKLGDTVTWAGIDWIVTHITANRMFLTAKTIQGSCTWDELSNSCTDFAYNKLTQAQRNALLDVSYGSTCGKVFVASYSQMNGGLSYFNSNGRRGLNQYYWISSVCPHISNDRLYAYVVNAENNAEGQINYENGSIGTEDWLSQSKCGFRPSICIDISNMPKPFELPDRSQLTLGNTITWADKQWIVVSNPTSTACNLTLASLDGTSTFSGLKTTCSNWASTNLNEKQLAALRSISAGNTSGKVFVATADHMNGGFAYFNSADKRKSTDTYWTSTQETKLFYEQPQYVDANGNVTSDRNTDVGMTKGFRPSVQIDMSLYN